MFVGIDVGTGSVKAVLGFAKGLHTITEKYNRKMYSGGTHKLPYFHESVMSLFKRVSLLAAEMNEKIAGVGICGHGPSIIAVDTDGNPLTGIITWQDSSALSESDELRETIEGFTKDGTSYEAKLYKLYKMDNKVFLDSARVLFPKDYVIYLLTGRMILDSSTASTLFFFDPDTRKFNTFNTGIPAEVFPDIVDPWDEAGKTGTGFSRGCGLKDNIPVIAGGIDAWCEALGAGAIQEGVMVDGSGTSTCITCCNSIYRSGYRHVIPGKSLCIETMSSTGASLAWLADILCVSVDDIKQISDFTPVPVIYLPYLNGERSPVWDEKASALFSGFVSDNGRSDIIRSVFQGISFGTRQCIDTVLKKNICKDHEIRAVGGGADNEALVQYKADISGFSYVVMKEPDAAPLGAMLLASFGCKEGTLEALTAKWVETGKRVVPGKEYAEIWDQLFKIYTEQYEIIKGSMHSLFAVRNSLKTYKYQGVDNAETWKYF